MDNGESVETLISFINSKMNTYIETLQNTVNVESNGATTDSYSKSVFGLEFTNAETTSQMQKLQFWPKILQNLLRINFMRWLLMGKQLGSLDYDLIARNVNEESFVKLRHLVKTEFGKKYLKLNLN